MLSLTPPSLVIDCFYFCLPGSPLRLDLGSNVLEQRRKVNSSRRHFGNCRNLKMSSRITCLPQMSFKNSTSPQIYFSFVCFLNLSSFCSFINVWSDCVRPVSFLRNQDEALRSYSCFWRCSCCLGGPR